MKLEEIRSNAQRQAYAASMLQNSGLTYEQIGVALNRIGYGHPNQPLCRQRVGELIRQHKAWVQKRQAIGVDLDEYDQAVELLSPVPQPPEPVCSYCGTKA